MIGIYWLLWCRTTYLNSAHWIQKWTAVIRWIRVRVILTRL